MLAARVRNMALAAALFATAACARNPEPEETGPAPRTTLRVENQAFLDMNIFVVFRGQRHRVGTAGGNRTTMLELPIRITTMETLSFIADPIGSPRQPVTDEIMVSPGDVITMRIPPQ